MVDSLALGFEGQSPLSGYLLSYVLPTWGLAAVSMIQELAGKGMGSPRSP